MLHGISITQLMYPLATRSLLTLSLSTFLYVCFSGPHLAVALNNWPDLGWDEGNSPSSFLPSEHALFVNFFHFNFFYTNIVRNDFDVARYVFLIISISDYAQKIAA
jgi:hypothetical protein